ncbi:hypothetical protein M747DRAFT_254043 [Aspergillus niger ATCC 13496]|uniref:Protein kinase domain-containing protein n=1 Tax=Aspergillus niger ATCC 13496 TaxID=1353008 RepID=A0A370C891_ASPNG|nr:hypothetical protein M747DRAFT_254043 [Aspergillus niger ATCC 13496]
MDPVSLALAVVSVTDLCFKYGNRLIGLCRQYQSLASDLAEIILSIQAAWIKMDIQLKSLRSLCDKLDYPLLLLYHDALTLLEAKLAKATDSFQVIQRKNNEAFHVHQKLKAVYLKRELSQTVEDLEGWQRRFDPSWYLITRIADPDVDRRLRDVRRSQHTHPSSSTFPSPAARLTWMRESIQQISPQSLPSDSDGPNFKDAAAVSSGMYRVEGTDAYLSRLNNTPRRVLLDPANLHLGHAQSQISPATLRQNIRDLARLLRHVDPSTFHLLRCDGIVELPTTQGNQFHLLFEIPQNLQLSKPKALRSLLPHTGNGKKCSLTQRLLLAKQLAHSVMFVHAAGFVHKNIRPGTIIAFQDDTSDRLGPSFLIGFERIRRAEGRTDKFGDLDWEKNLYRHPLRQGLQPEEIFEMRHDIYSLGVCLLEIALWESFVNFDSRGQVTPWSGLNITAALQDTDQRRGAFAVKERLVDMARDALPSLVGERFTGIVLACLCCLDQSVDNALWDPKELQDRDGIVVGVKYIENVSIWLSFCLRCLFVVSQGSILLLKVGFFCLGPSETRGVGYMRRSAQSRSCPSHGSGLMCALSIPRQIMSLAQ